MPIYEYACKECGEKFDALRSMKDADTPIECKKCHSPNTRRLISSCFAQGNGISASSSAHSCGGCQGGSCGSCGH